MTSPYFGKALKGPGNPTARQSFLSLQIKKVRWEIYRTKFKTKGQEGVNKTL
jgi:hypothetical protein